MKKKTFFIQKTGFYTRDTGNSNFQRANIQLADLNMAGSLRVSHFYTRQV